MDLYGEVISGAELRRRIGHLSQVGGEGQYAVGIEPCTNGFGREAVKAAGELIVLQPGESRTYRTRVAIIGADEADALRR